MKLIPVVACILMLFAIQACTLVSGPAKTSFKESRFDGGDSLRDTLVLRGTMEDIGDTIRVWPLDLVLDAGRGVETAPIEIEKIHNPFSLSPDPYIYLLAADSLVVRLLPIKNGEPIELISGYFEPGKYQLRLKELGLPVGPYMLECVSTREPKKKIWGLVR